MRRAVWVWVLVAFVVGLLPGGGAAWFLWRTNRESRAQLISRNTALHAENQALQARLNATEASVSVLTRQLEQQNAQSSGTAVSSAGGSAGTAPTGPPGIFERSVSPEQVAAGGQITLTIKLKGHAEIAKMRVVGGSFDKIYDLARESFDSTGEVWQKRIKAPSSPGTYRYYAIANAAGKKYTMPGVSGWSFVVK
ncbi:MAG TPA: hypothetical protein VGK50_08995 [Coriobacteriia bacterium]|jgi:hypothetical protein